MMFSRSAVVALALCASPALAIEPFVVKDIRVEGIQRTEAGTVFSYLPIKVGDTVDDDRIAAALKALYATGFFKDVKLEAEGDVLIVQIEERPAISQITITGAKEFTPEQLKDGLKQIGLSEAQIFNRSLLDRAEQEVKRQYLDRGKYGVVINTVVTPLERNRVAISFDINEGDIARIRQINIVGNRAFSEKALLKLFTLTTPGYLTWFTKNDQYSKQKLSADVETLRSHYLNRGYLEFNVDSTQVSITPDRKDIYITINITEGPRYTVSDIKLAGELLVPEAELKSLVKIKAGDTFSREKLTESTKAIGERLGNDGYAFANVNAVPEVNKETQQVAFTFFVDPGRRVYVRRINITGNTKTRDEVLRREMRQLESGWYSGEKLNRSRERLERLGFFENVNLETPPVPGTTDQVDVNVNVAEKSTGNVLVGAGFSSSDGFIMSGSVTQSNLFGSGNQFAAQINNSKVNTVYSLSFTNPYYTADGVSRGFDLYKRDVDSTSLVIGRYSSSTAGVGMRFGVPISENDSINFGIGFEQTKIGLFDDSPQRYKDFVNVFGPSNNTLRGDISFARDSRDSLLYPTKGRYQRAFLEAGLPGGDLKFYKTGYQHQIFLPVGGNFVLMLNGEVGIGNGYGGKPLPFFKNFYAGGPTSVRGYETGSLGPRDSNDESLGGNRRIVGNAELLFPFPGLRNDKSVRMSVFTDVGAIYGTGEKLGSQGLRYSAGISVNWFSPIGPLKFSIAQPLSTKPGDKKEVFQFQLGSSF